MHDSYVTGICTPEKVGSVGVADERLEVLVLLLQVLADIEELPALVLPEIALHVLAFKGAHLHSQSLESIICLQFHLPLSEDSLFQLVYLLLILHADSMKGTSLASSVQGAELLDLPVSRLQL